MVEIVDKIISLELGDYIWYTQFWEMIFWNYEKMGLELDKTFHAHKDKTREE